MADTEKIWVRDIQHLSENKRLELVSMLIPPQCFQTFAISPESFRDHSSRFRLRILYRNHGRILGVRITNPHCLIDPIYSLFIQDYDEEGLEVIGYNINDPSSPRYQVDLDEFGRIPADLFSSGRRNIQEEIKAMRAGLAPGQVRRGLRWTAQVVSCVEEFCKTIGKRYIYCEAMAYHNAMVYEKYGFTYLFNMTFQEMIWIDRQFRPPKGILFARMDGSTPFRQPGMERTVRGRSWAIHDGVLGRPWNKPYMVKEIGVHAQVNTFPDAVY